MATYTNPHSGVVPLPLRCLSDYVQIEMINGHLRLANVEVGRLPVQQGAWLGPNMLVGLSVCLFVYLQLSSQFEL